MCGYLVAAALIVLAIAAIYLLWYELLFRIDVMLMRIRRRLWRRMH